MTFFPCWQALRHIISYGTCVHVCLACVRLPRFPWSSCSAHDTQRLALYGVGPESKVAGARTRVIAAIATIHRRTFCNEETHDLHATHTYNETPLHYSRNGGSVGCLCFFLGQLRLEQCHLLSFSPSLCLHTHTPSSHSSSTLPSPSSRFLTSPTLFSSSSPHQFNKLLPRLKKCVIPETMWPPHVGFLLSCDARLLVLQRAGLLLHRAPAVWRSSPLRQPAPGFRR